MYREEAVDAFTTALMRNLTDSDAEKLQHKCCKALLILGGFFSSSGKLMTEDWILTLPGFLNFPDWKNDTDIVHGTVTTGKIDDDDEEEEEEQEQEQDKKKQKKKKVQGRNG